MEALQCRQVIESDGVEGRGRNTEAEARKRMVSAKPALGRVGRWFGNAGVGKGV
ncbi:hypothetical protein CRG98_026308, partial [Punica granatum]